MPTFNISLNKDLAEIVENLMKIGKYSTRSELFRELIRYYYLGSRKDYVIERLSPDDPDYKEAKRLSKNAKYIPLKEFRKRLK